MAGPTYFGSASTPADNGSQAGAGPIAITPPASMTAGQFVRVLVAQRVAGEEETFSVPTTGGQTWYPLAWRSTTNLSWAIFACIFNGTWSANPQFQQDQGSTTPLTAKMDVFSPSAAGKIIDVAMSPILADFAAGTTPFTKTITGITTIIANEMVIADWISVDDNTYGSLTAGWTNAGGSQIRNAAGSQTSVSTAYRAFASPGATGNVSQNQATNGGDLGSTSIMSIYERDANSSSVPAVDVFWTAENSTNGTAMTDTILNAGTTLAAASGSWQTAVGAGGPNLSVSTSASNGLGTRAFSVSGSNITDSSGTRGMSEDNNNQGGAPYNFAWVKNSVVTKMSSFCWWRTSLPYGIFDAFTQMGLQDGAFQSGCFLSLGNYESASHRIFQENCASEIVKLPNVVKDTWYGIAMYVDVTNNIGRMTIFDSSLNQIGFSTGLRLGTSPANVDRMILGSFGGNYPTPANPTDYIGSTTFFDDLALDFSATPLYPLVPQVPASGFTGTLAQTLGALTSSGAASVDISGTLAKTLGALSGVSAGTADIAGVTAKTLGALTSVSSGTVDIAATVAKTLGPLTLVSAVDSGGGAAPAGAMSLTLSRRRVRV